MHKRARPDRRSQAPPMPVCAQSVSPPVCTIHRTAPTRPWNRGASQMTRHAHGTWDKVRVRWTRQRRRLSIEHQTSRPDWLPRRIDKWAGEDCVDSLAYLAPVVKPFPRAIPSFPCDLKRIRRWNELRRGLTTSSDCATMTLYRCLYMWSFVQHQ